MKIFQYITLLVLFSSLMFVSCDESSLSSGPEQSPEEKILAKQMAYDKNPYDKEGAMHNEFLDYFITHKDSTKELLDIYAKFYHSKDMEFGDEQMAAYRELFQTYRQIPSIGGPYTETFCEKYPRFCDILTPSPTFPIPIALLGENNGDTSTERTLQFIKAVKTNENQIIADKGLSDRQRKALLTQHAVARYSAGYWHNVTAIQKEESGYYGPFQKSEAALIDVVAADELGAIVGGIIGGPAGAGYGAASFSIAAVLENFWSSF